MHKDGYYSSGEFAKKSNVSVRTIRYYDQQNILKPSLARGELQLIGATTLEEYRKHIEKDAALERRACAAHGLPLVKPETASLP